MLGGISTEQKRWLRVKDFAGVCHCTPQNIYRHLALHSEELKNHVRKGPGRQGTLLDPEACKFLCSVMCGKKIPDNGFTSMFWNDDSCVGYAIYAMESAGISAEEIQNVVQAFPGVLAERTHREAAQYGKQLCNKADVCLT